MKTCLYRHFDSADKLLYVGISLNSIKRLQQHRFNSNWFLQIARVEIEWHSTRVAALTAEAIAIARENPMWNIARPKESSNWRAVPLPSATNVVPVRGEALSEVLWQGVQWAVTTAGIECRDGTYFIAAKRLRESEPDWSWKRQMAEKSWVDQADFAAAFAVACWVHRGERAELSRLLTVRGGA